ncbi:MAG: phospholipid carrier-dependent glycosyltransferase [Phormidesmis sp.]
MTVISLSFGLRFWQLTRFNDLVFDEIYFVKFAQSYLAGSPQFDAHPPLGKYFIAAGIWLSAHVPIISWPFATAVNPETGLSPFSYRWMNALIGSCIPVLVMAIAHTLCQWKSTAKQKTFVLLSGFFVAIDGLFVTESRYALLNIYMVFFGLLGHWLWLQATLRADADERLSGKVYRVLAGVALGGAIAVKWNGLGYLLSLLLWDMFARKSWQVNTRRSRHYLLEGLIYGILTPIFTYSLIWWPHLYLTGESLMQVHANLLSFHQQLAPLGHPACSKWYTWPLLIKPIAYWYKSTGTQAYTVNNLGNPALWWLSGSAITLLFLQRASNTLRSLQRKLTDKPVPISSTAPNLSTSYLGTYLLIGYAANWLPWIVVDRCTFIYLYMPAAVFSFMVLACLLGEWLYSPTRTLSRTMGIAVLGIIIMAFLFWLPLSIGSPLSLKSLQLRWWLKSWI